jgi:hypothetical protein
MRAPFNGPALAGAMNTTIAAAVNNKTAFRMSDPPHQSAVRRADPANAL